MISTQNSHLQQDLNGSYLHFNDDFANSLELHVSTGRINIGSNVTSKDFIVLIGNNLDATDHHSKTTDGKVTIAGTEVSSPENIDINLSYSRINGNYILSRAEGGRTTANNGKVEIKNAKLTYTGRDPNKRQGIVGNSIVAQGDGEGSLDDLNITDGHVSISNSIISELDPKAENQFNQIIGSDIRGAYQNITAQAAFVSVLDSTVQADIFANRIYQPLNASCLEGVISITGSKVSGSVYGGFVWFQDGVYEDTSSVTPLSKTNSNTIRITNSTIVGETIAGGHSVNLGSAEAYGNTITIEKSTITNKIYGAMATAGNTHPKGYSKAKATVTENTISIFGAENDIGDVVAGYASVSNSSKAYIANNKIELLNASGAEFTKANLKGYEYTLNNDPNSEFVAEGNTLLVQNWTGKVNSINNFNNIKFEDVQWKNEGVVLEVINGDGKDSDLSQTWIDISGSTYVAADEELKVNDYMYFLHRSDEGNFKTDKEHKVNPTEGEDGIFTVRDGVAFEGTGKVEVEDNGSVKYVITEVKNSDQAEEVPERQAAGQAFVLQTNDLIVDGLNAVERDQLLGTRLFAIGEGAYSKYDVSDKLKIHGWNGMVGAGGVKQNDESDLAWAGFFEFGDANSRFWYDIGDIHHRTDAEFHYRGFGLALRERYDNGWYWDASGRAGIIHTESENAFMAGDGDFYDGDVHTTYFSFHLGAGRVIPLENNRSLDLFARFFYTQFDGEDFDIAGDRFVIDKAESKQLRTGGRWSFKLDQPMNFYLGAALEYEFDGDNNGSVNGHALKESSLGGATGYGEFGFKYRKELESPWDYEGRIRGYFGVREGVSGVLRATYTF